MDKVTIELDPDLSSQISFLRHYAHGLQAILAGGEGQMDFIEYFQFTCLIRPLEAGLQRLDETINNTST